MCVEAIWNACTKEHFVVLIATPYESQCRLLMTRLNELIDNSPMVKAKKISSTKSPYEIHFKGDSRIVAFTTGASSNQGGNSIRGQRSDLILVDEMDYLGDNDFDNLLMLCAERPSIKMIVSSTPSGKRGAFYSICTDPNSAFSQHYHPSTHNPLYNEQMELEFRQTLTQVAYDHEVLALFGDEVNGVFDKNCLDKAIAFDNYAYDELDEAQLMQIENAGGDYPMMYLPIAGKFKPNVFRCIGCDWDKYAATSSIVILDYDTRAEKFRVIKRVIVSRSEYSYDAAVQTIIKLNEIYNPSWIYCDRGAGEYQIERLHIYGDEHPESGLKNKVKGWQFANKISVPDPVKKTTSEHPLKPFMVNSLALQIERNNLILSPYDQVLYKQLIDYQVVRISQSGQPVYSDKDEHCVDSLGLAMLAFTLEFPSITQNIKEIKTSSKIVHLDSGFQERKAQLDLIAMEKAANTRNPWVNNKFDPTDRPGDRPTYFKVPLGSKGPFKTVQHWGSRSSLRGGSPGRSMW